MKPVSKEKFKQKLKKPILKNSFDEYSTEIKEDTSLDDNREMAIARVKELLEYAYYSLSNYESSHL